MHFSRVRQLHDRLFVHAAKHARVQPFLEFFHRRVQHESSIMGTREHQFVFGFECDHIFHIHQNQFGTRSHHQTLEGPIVAAGLVQASPLGRRLGATQPRD